MNTLNLQNIQNSLFDHGVRYYTAGELGKLPYSSNSCECWILILVKEGVFSCLDKEYPSICRKGLLTLPSWVKVGNLISQNGFRGCAVSIPSGLVLRMDISMNLNQTQLFGPFMPLPEREIRIVDAYMSLIKDTLANSSSHYSGVELFCICKALLLSCCRYYNANKLDHVHINRNPKVSKFLDLLWRDCTVHRDLAYYSEKLCVSTKYLSSLISKETGRNANQWISEATISIAKKLLADRNLSIENVAAALHFKSSSDFCKYFKRYTGLTALQYRNQA